ncbi:MAG: FtsX-like permease family protein [Eubacterium sp.]|nr:FtsX-like permease family protein [Eubacterium sp.]
MRALQKDTLREIKKSLSRFLSIVAIIALGVSFFGGVKSTSPSMKHTADQYYTAQNLMDLRLVSTYGFTDEDIAVIGETQGVARVQGAYSADLLVKAEGKQPVAKVYSLPAEGDINAPVLMAGRLPKAEDECVLEVQEIMGDDLGKVSYAIGSTITFADKTGDTAVTDTLKRAEYTVVGYVRSPLYVSIERGSTTVGTGSVDFYMMVGASEFKSERYTEAYVIGDFHGEDLSGYDADYDAQVAAMAEKLETVGDRLLEESYSDMVREGQQEIDKGKRELKKAQDTFDTEIAQAEATLADSEGQLAEGEESLAQGKERLEAELAQGQKTLEESAAQLSEGKTQYEEGLKAYEAGLAEYQAGQAAFDAAKPQAEAGFAEAEAQLAEASAQIEALKQAIAALEASDPSNPALPAMKEQLSQAQAAHQSGSDELASQKEAFYAQESALSSAKTQLDQSKATLDASAAQLAAGEQALAEGKQRLETGRLQGEEQLSQAQAEIDSGRAALAEGQSEYENQKAEGERQLADAEAEIAEGEKQLEDIPEGMWYIFDRSDNPGYTSYGEDADRIDKVASIFPVFFLLVAALVSFTTMTRMVEEGRMEIGTLKALGYGYRQIAAKYIFYAAAAAVIGCVLGIVSGVNTLPYLITQAYSLLYNMPGITLYVPWIPVLLSCLAAFVCTTGAAVGITWFEFKSEPSELMRPKAPKIGKRIFMERITPLWRRMGFISKVTARNIFRYKARFIMTVVGIAGCTALILAGFGLQDAIFSIVPRQFGEISVYEAIAAFKDEGTAEQKAEILQNLAEDEDVAEVLAARQMKMDVSSEEGRGSKEVYTVMPQDPGALSDFVDLHDRKHPEEAYTLNDEGVVVTEKLARDLEVSVGDTLELSADNERFSVKIAAIAENYIENYVYISPDYYQEVSGKTPTYNLAYMNLNISGTEAEDALAQRWLAGDDVVSMTFTEGIKNSSMDSLQSLNMVVLVMLAAAGALAFVVLYNLTNINVSERVREIATIRVLGFYEREVDNYIFRENIVLSLIGMVFGLFLGVLLNNFIITTVETNIVMFGRGIDLSSYLFACLFTMAFTLIVNICMKPVIKKIDMVESLKSIE